MSDCLFCKIIKKEIPAEIEFESKDLVVIKDINPQDLQHLLIIPKKHIERVSDMGAEDAEVLGASLSGEAPLYSRTKRQEHFRLDQ